MVCEDLFSLREKKIEVSSAAVVIGADWNKYIYYRRINRMVAGITILYLKYINPCPAEPGYTLPLQTV